MHHRGRLVVLDDRLEPGLVKQITALEWAPLHRPFEPPGEVVVNHGCEAGHCQRLAGVGADVTGSSSHQDLVCQSGIPLYGS